MRKYSRLSVVTFAAILAIFFVSCDLITGEIDPNSGVKYTVTFDSNGGSTINSASVENGRTLEKPSNPVKVDYTFDRDTGRQHDTNYVFIGWYTDTTLKNRFDFSSPVTADMTLYAKWRTVASSAITIGETTYEKTEEVYAIDPDKIDEDITTITGSTPSFVDESADSSFIGVFWGGREVSLSPFIMSRYEVTQELYADVMAGNSDGVLYQPWTCTNSNYELPENEEQQYRPVESVTWYDAVYFCNKLTEKVFGTNNAYKAYTITNISVDSASDDFPGHITSATVTLDLDAIGYRLPTEAEWEFAARGGETDSEMWNYMFSGSKSETDKKCTDRQNSGLDSVGWYAFNRCNENGNTDSIIPSEDSRYSDGTHEVGLKAANELGLYDMSGNVYEWCYDIPIKSNELNPVGSAPNEDTRHVIRGGSWFNEANGCVVSCQTLWAPDRPSKDIGFRVVRKGTR